MTVADLLSTLTRIFFLTLSLLTLLTYLRKREAITRDIALAFGSIGVSVATSSIGDIMPAVSPFVPMMGSLALMAQPHLLLQLARYLQPVSLYARRASWLGMLSAWVCVLVYSPSLPVPAIIGITGYFVVINTYVMVIFIRGTRLTTGVVQRRTHWCAIGSGLFALTLLLAGVAAIVTDFETVLTPFVLLSAIGSATCFLLGIAPPRWLRRLWQFVELRDYFAHLSQSPITDPDRIAILTELTRAANRAVDGSSAMVLELTVKDDGWHMIYSTNPLTADNLSIQPDSIVHQVWQNPSPTYVTMDSRLKVTDRNLLDALQAKALILMPIQTANHMVAQLLIFLKYRSLFLDDDVELLRLLAQQGAIYLENLHLIEQLRHRFDTRFARVLDTTAEAVITIDATQRIILFNPSAERIFGYRAEECLGQSLEMLLPPDVIQRHRQFVTDFTEEPDIARGMGQRQRELFAKHRDGTIFPIEASISKLTEGDDVILTVFIRDVTEQRQATEALRQRHAYLNLQQQVTVAANEATSTTTSLRQAIHLICSSVGFPLGHIYKPGHESDGLLVSMSIWYADNSEDYNAFRTITEDTPVPMGVGIGQVLIDHQAHWYSDISDIPQFLRGEAARAAGIYTAIFVPVLIRDEVVAAMEFFSDKPLPRDEALLAVLRHIGTQLGRVFERARTEQTLRQLNEMLEQRVADRTAHLEAVNKELEAFSYSVSHDLRAPLRALDGFSHALAEDYTNILDDIGLTYLDRIQFESQRMGQLIDDLIDLSYFTRSDLHREFVDVSRMVQDIAETLQAQDPQRQVDFVIQEDLMVCADSHLLRVALENLLANAWKYSSQQSHARIEFAAREETDRTVYVVRDNGAGFDMAYVHKLFGAFQRLHAGTEYEGTGIGLATVQRIIHRHGGTVWAEGIVNEGATFSFTLGDGNCEESGVKRA